MEEEIAKYRLQPQSRTPSYVYPSTNSSSTNLPSYGSTNGADMSERREISSSLLQERLRERRAESLKVSKRRGGSESTSDDNSRIVSSPLGSSVSSRPAARRPSTAYAPSERKGNMGVKEMEEVLDKLHKQNWDLKLELYHRRKRQTEQDEKYAVLEEKNIELRDRLKEYAEIQQVNEQLMEELQQRDQAVEEAVLLICSLEEKLECLEGEKSHVQSVDRDYLENLRSSPPQLDFLRETMASPGLSDHSNVLAHIPSLKRVPSFLTNDSKSTEALRSLFRPNRMDNHELPELDEDADEVHSGTSDRSHSPQLSVLSESSFRSVYGQDRSILDGIHDKKTAESPFVSRFKPSVKPSPGLLPSSKNDREKYLSLDRVASSPVRRIDGVKRRLEHSLRNTKGISVSTSSKDDLDVGSRKSSGLSANVNHYNSEFLLNRMPPTPDTISTNTLHQGRNSYDTLDKSSDSDDDQNSADSHNLAVKIPSPTSYFTRSPIALEQSQQVYSNGRPHSAEETVNTSGEQGYDWDRGSRADHTEMDGALSTTTDPWLDSAQEYGNLKSRKGVEAPQLFDFSATDDWVSAESTKSIVRDLLFNTDHASGYSPERNLSSRRGSEPSLSPRSDHTVHKKVERADVGDAQLPGRVKNKPPVTLKSISRPPASYSSTSHVPTAIPTTPSSGAAASIDIDRKGSITKRSRLPAFLGGRSETISNAASIPSDNNDTQSSPPQTVLQHNPFQRKRHNSIGGHLSSTHPADTTSKSQMSPRYLDHPGSSATPPAIMDNRGQSARKASGLRTPVGYQSITGRPGTSGSLDSRLPMASGSGDSVEYQAVSPKVDNRSKTDGNGESKIGKFKGVVMKTLGRRS